MQMIRRLCITCLTFVALLAVRPVAAQPVHQDRGTADRDEYNPNAQLGSTGVYAGLVMAPADPRANPVRLLVYIPPVRADSLCVDLISYDGQYTGRFRFTPPSTSDWFILNLPTQWGRRLREYGTESLAPLAHLAAVCSNEDEKGLSVPAGWGEVPRTLRLRVLVNPQAGADWVFTDWSVPASRPAACQLLDYVPRVAYGYSCDVDPPASYGASELRIVQMDGPNPFKPIPVPVWVPRGR
jgi:hypothetical protein